MEHCIGQLGCSSYYSQRIFSILSFTSLNADEICDSFIYSAVRLLLNKGVASSSSELDKMFITNEDRFLSFKLVSLTA